MSEAQRAASGEGALRVGPYRILRTLDVTSTTEVLLAVSEGPHGFERKVVLKRLTPGAQDPIVLRSLAREAVAYARLNHPAVVRLYDFVQVDDLPVMVLEYVDGTTLSRLLGMLGARYDKLPEDAALHIGECLFAALEAAHSARDPGTNEFAPVIHRDVTPQNLLLTRDGEVKLSDFGLAKLVGAPSTDTVSGGVLSSTTPYMAPEQVVGKVATVRTDVYAGALVLREMLTGQAAFPQGGMTALQYLQWMAHPKLAPIEKTCPGLPAELKAALDRALEGDPDARAITAAEMYRVLRAANEGRDGQQVLADLLSRLASPVPSDRGRVSAVVARSPLLPVENATLAPDPKETPERPIPAREVRTPAPVTVPVAQPRRRARSRGPLVCLLALVVGALVLVLAAPMSALRQSAVFRQAEAPKLAVPVPPVNDAAPALVQRRAPDKR